MTTKLIDLTAEIVANYVAGNRVAASELPGLIQATYRALATPEGEDTNPSAAKLTAAQIRKSITPAALISFEDGRPYKTLKRHLGLRDLTPAGYREKWGLPAGYPMTAPEYSAQRSELAKALELGHRGRGARKAATIEKPAPRPRGRPRTVKPVDTTA